MRLIWLAVVVLLVPVMVSASISKPIMWAFEEEVNIADSNIELFFTLSVPSNGSNISYHSLVVDAIDYANITDDSYSFILPEGNYTLLLCAFALNESSCSDSLIISVRNITVPEIGGIPSMMTITPIYGDFKQSKRVFGIKIRDKHQVSINASMSAYDDDIYGDDFDGSVKINCSERDFLDNYHYFNCTIVPSYIIQSGYYDVKIVANNSEKSATRTFRKVVAVNTLVSAKISNPAIDYGNTYGGWIEAEQPIVVENLGNAAFSKVAVRTRDIECSGYTFSVERILVGIRDNRAAAMAVFDEIWFNSKIRRGEFQNIYLFIENPDDRDPASCRFTWDLKLAFERG